MSFLLTSVFSPEKIEPFGLLVQNPVKCKPGWVSDLAIHWDNKQEYKTYRSMLHEQSSRLSLGSYFFEETPEPAFESNASRSRDLLKTGEPS